MRNSFRWAQRGWGIGMDVRGGRPATHLPPRQQVLIGDEPEPGMENLLEVQVPEDVETRLQQLDRQEREQHTRGQPEQPAPEPQAEGATPT